MGTLELIPAIATKLVNPTAVPGLVAWYDASDISSLWKDTARTSAVTADGDAVLGVTDKSGVARHLSEATNGPTYKTGISPSGRSVLRFDGTNDKLTSGAGSAVTQGFTVVAAVSWASISATTLSWLCGASFLPVMGRATDGYRFYAGTVQAGGHGNTSFHDHVAIFNGASSSYRVDGSAVLSSNPGAGSFTSPFQLGAEIPSPFMACDIGEFCLYSSALSGADLSMIEGYIKTKWGTP